jgi:polyisoprenyl-phosphate glycosyltransferase
MSTTDLNPLLQARSPARRLSIVIPIYNEEETIPFLRRAIDSFCETLLIPVEIVLVDDGSKDKSLCLLAEWAQQDPRILVVALARNFGHQAAATAGLDHASGDAIVLIDADLQDPLEVIHEMLQKFLEGYDVVYGQRKSRAGETPFKLATAWIFYRILQFLGYPELPSDTGDFRLISRRCLDALKELREQDRFLRGLVTWVGFMQTSVLYERRARVAGKTKYPFKEMVRFASDGIFSFSIMPLRVSFLFGSVVSGLGILYGAIGIVRYFIWGDTVRGWTSLIVITGLGMGTILFSVGILGEYIGRIYVEVKRRPLYVIASSFSSMVRAQTGD